MGFEINKFDADGHITEPPDLWENYIESKYKDSCPKMYFEDNGRTEIFRIDGETTHVSHMKPLRPSIATGANFGMQDGSAEWGRSYLEGDLGGFDSTERIKWLDSEGFDATVLFPTMMLPLLWYMKDVERVVACTAAYNRYLIDFCMPYPDRLYGAAVLPMISVNGAIEQAKFAANAGLKAVVIKPNPVAGKPLHHPDFYPVWSVLQDLNLGLGIHGSAVGNNIGADRFGTPGDDLEGSYSVVHSYVHTAEMMAAYTSSLLKNPESIHHRHETKRICI